MTTFAVSVLLHPEYVYISEYWAEVPVGLTVSMFPPAPVFQRKMPPEGVGTAVSVRESPSQISEEAGFMEIMGI